MPKFICQPEYDCQCIDHSDCEPCQPRLEHDAYISWSCECPTFSGAYTQIPPQVQGILDSASMVPRWLTDMDTLNSVSVPPWLHSYRDQLSRNLKSDQHIQFVDEDPDPHLAHSLPNILSATYELERMERTMSLDRDYTDATWRLPIDKLIQHAFSLPSDGAIFSVELNTPISVPCPSTDGAPATNEADLAVFSEHHKFFDRFTSKPIPIKTQANLECNAHCFGSFRNLSMLIWASEYRMTPYHKFWRRPFNLYLMYDLASALYQRRALGLKEQCVFGTVCEVSEFNNGSRHVSVCAAWWDISDEYRFVIKSVWSLHLDNPIDALRLYLLIRAVCRYNNSLCTEVQALTADSIIVAQNTYEGDWKAHLIPDGTFSLDNVMAEQRRVIRSQECAVEDGDLKECHAEESVGQDSG